MSETEFKGPAVPGASPASAPGATALMSERATPFAGRTVAHDEKCLHRYNRCRRFLSRCSGRRHRALSPHAPCPASTRKLNGYFADASASSIELHEDMWASVLIPFIPAALAAIVAIVATRLRRARTQT